MKSPLKERGGSRETIGAEQMGYRFVSGGEVQEFLDSQNILEWLPNRLRGRNGIYHDKRPPPLRKKGCASPCWN